MGKINYGPRTILTKPPIKTATQNFKSTEYRRDFLDGVASGPIKPGSRLNYASAESIDYQTSLGISFSFSRWTAEAVYNLELRDFIDFTTGESAKSIIKKLRSLADRLEKSCVDEVEGKVKPF